MEGLRDLGIETFTLDVTNAGNIAQLRKQIEELTGGTLNILVNNAYVSYIHHEPYYSNRSLFDRGIRKLYGLAAVVAVSYYFNHI